MLFAHISSHPHASYALYGSYAYLSVLRQEYRLYAEERQRGTTWLLTPAFDGQGSDSDGTCIAECVCIDFGLCIVGNDSLARMYATSSKDESDTPCVVRAQ